MGRWIDLRRRGQPDRWPRRHDPSGAVFKGLAISGAPTAGPELFVADVANATVEVFNKDFAPISTPTEFVDPAIPSGYAPFNVQALNGDIYVTYGKQTIKPTLFRARGSATSTSTAQTASSNHLINGGSGSPLNEPWGLAIAPAKFAPFAGDLLVGNLGNGWINAFNPTTGAFIGALDSTTGYPIVIPGLWGLQVGNASFGGKNALVFSSGPKQYAHGVLGILTPAA